MIINLHPRAVELGVTSPQYAGLSDFHFNPAVGCAYGCRFCFIGDLFSKSQAEVFSANGVTDAAKEHGKYLLIRPFDETAFVRALERADGKFCDRSGIIAYSTTTDPYMQLPKVISKAQPAAQALFDDNIERSLMLVLLKSSLNVRILTRSPYSRRHFDLFGKFDDRLMFGMSVPTLNEGLSKKYEPHAPRPKDRLRTLREAKKAGLHVFVCMSPTYPECDEADITATMEAIALLDPVTIFHEPINLRGDLLQRLPTRRINWVDYAMMQFGLVHKVAARRGLLDRLHFLPCDTLRDRGPAWFDYWRSHAPAWPEVIYCKIAGKFVRR